MKNKINYIVILAISIFLHSCENAIDIEQVGRLTPEKSFETINDLQQGLNGAYSQFDILREIAMSANYTDEVAEGIATGGQGRNTGHVFQLNAASAAASSFWTIGYDELNALNRVIEAGDLVETKDATELATKNNILGQAYALRAFSHFTLLSYYSTDYSDDNALAAIKMDFVPSVADKLLRNTNAEFYQSIEEDLNIANSLLQRESDPTFVSKDFVTALRARMAAYRQDYVAAERHAQALLNKYPLADRDQYELMFFDQDNTEIIFKFERAFGDIFDDQPGSGTVGIGGGWVGGVFAFVNATAGGGAYYEFNRSLFNLFDPNDIRYDVCLAPDSTVSSDYQNSTNYFEEDILIIAKYPGSEGQFLMNDLKVFRASEMQLILAEAKAGNGDLPGAAQALKTLRDARFGSDTPLLSFSNDTEAYAAILNERRVELAFEGHRWKDIKRLGVRANQGAVRDPLDASTFNMTPSLAPDDYRFTLPLPLVEFNGNPELRTQQNPGY
jgi:starch-binding outer membrane protein, SusD/RagB family